MTHLSRVEYGRYRSYALALVRGVLICAFNDLQFNGAVCKLQAC